MQYYYSKCLKSEQKCLNFRHIFKNRCLKTQLFGTVIECLKIHTSKDLRHLQYLVSYFLEGLKEEITNNSPGCNDMNDICIKVHPKFQD